MKVLESLTKIPRQVIFVTIALAIIVPLIVPIGIPVNIMPQTQKLFDAIDSLGPNSEPILLSCDFDPQSMPELYPMLTAIMRHCFARNIKIMLMSLWPTGPGLVEMAVDAVPKEFNKVYGKDFISLGYKAGGSAVILGMGESIRDVFPTDYYGTPIDSLPMMKNVKNYKDISLIVSLSAGDPGYRTWLLYAQSRYEARVGTGVTAVSAADAYPFVESGQLVGLISGMKGASEYEVLVKKKGYSEGVRKAAQGMDAQSLGHLLIMIFIIIGNIGYFFSRRKR